MSIPKRDRNRLPAAERRKQIIEATGRLIAERGFWGLSMQDVADACGLTVPGLLHHVGSKDGLLVAVLDHRDAQDRRSLAALLGITVEEAATPGRVPLREICSALVARNARQPEIVRLFAVLEAESLAPDHPAHDYFAARQRRAVEDFADAIKAEAEPVFPDDAHRLARRIVAVMDGLQLVWLRDPAAVDLVAEWEAAAAVLFR